MTKRAERRLKQKKKLYDKHGSEVPVHKTHAAVASQPKIKNPILKFYNDNYKMLLIIPILLFILALVQISYQMSTNNGDFINKDISLKGGITITIPYSTGVNTVEMIDFLATKGYSANVRNIESSGKVIAVLIESDIDITANQTTAQVSTSIPLTDNETFDDNATNVSTTVIDEVVSSEASDESDEIVDGLLLAIQEKIPFEKKDISIQTIGSSIGDSFFKQTMIAVLFSFILMAIIVTITFRTFVPSIAVIAAALSDIVITIAIVNILGIKLSTAGIAALLMLIGYSVDTDILLTTRVLKRKEGSLLDRIMSAMKTGMLMNFTTIAVLTIGLMVSSSDVIKQIMTILFIGLLVDQINTWIQNVGILRLYIESKEKKGIKLVNNISSKEDSVNTLKEPEEVQESDGNESDESDVKEESEESEDNKSDELDVKEGSEESEVKKDEL